MTSSSRRTIPLLAALLGVLLPLIIALAGTVIWQGYRKGKEAAMEAGEQLFLSRQAEFARQQTELFEPLRMLISTFAEDRGFGAGESDRYLGPFMTVLESYPHVSSFRVGYDTGELFEVTAFRRADPGVPMAVMAPERAAYAVHTIEAVGHDLRENWRFFDADRAELNKRMPAGSADDPRRREWYIAAKEAPGRLAETLPYVFPFVNQPGISVAKAFYGFKSGVLAADVTLAQLAFSVSLGNDPDEQVFLFYNDGKLLAYPDLTQVAGPGPWNPDEKFVLPDASLLRNSVAQALMKRFWAGGGGFGLETLDVQGRTFLASVVRLNNSPVYLALALPEAQFSDAYDSISRDAVKISLSLVVLAIPVIVLVARRFAKPLALLVKETERIAHFDLGESASTPTRISEIRQLSDSMERMKAALGQVSKFVPKTLVQDLVRSGARMDVGGERRDISVVFTDVKDFTTLAESLPAEDLMAQMSEYFDVVVRCVLANHGTVDKYVGDAVFAFWNAPLRQENHEILACRAALSARTASNALNTQWRKIEKPEWYTRFGVHVGEAVVGNVGSSDRLDYTAIGDTVNMGSRLEGLNKFYGTQILASGPIAECAKEHFLFRPIDLVLPKGAIVPVEVCELLGACDAAAPDAATPAMMELCEAWRPVMERYKARDWRRALVAATTFNSAYPDDTVGQILQERIYGFLAKPPPPAWDGATRFENK